MIMMMMIMMMIIIIITITIIIVIIITVSFITVFAGVFLCASRVQTMHLGHQSPIITGIIIIIIIIVIVIVMVIVIVIIIIYVKLHLPGSYEIWNQQGSFRVEFTTTCTCSLQIYLLLGLYHALEAFLTFLGGQNFQIDQHVDIHANFHTNFQSIRHCVTQGCFEGFFACFFGVISLE